MPFPSPPWQMRGNLWLSVFVVASSAPDGTTDRPAGVYGVALVDYTEGSELTYQELLVARLVRDGVVPRVSITDIWVDSLASMEGGRCLWAIPKELARFEHTDRRTGPFTHSSWEAATDDVPVASAWFDGIRSPALRTPFRASTLQHRADGREVVTGFGGSTRALPCLGMWQFAPQGPLGWLKGRQPVVSWRLPDFRMTFGA